MNKEELLRGLTKEQIEKLNKCSSSEEILALAQEEGIELTDEQLAAVSGGQCDYSECPYCYHHDVTKLDNGKYKCNYCKRIW